MMSHRERMKSSDEWDAFTRWKKLLKVFDKPVMANFKPEISATRLFAAVSLVTAIVAFSTPVNASSEDAWEEFRAEVETACRSAAEDILEASEVIVDPFGSESYGIAVLSGPERGGDSTRRSVVCVFDKVSNSVEIGTPLDLPAL